MDPMLYCSDYFPLALAGLSKQNQINDSYGPGGKLTEIPIHQKSWSDELPSARQSAGPTQWNLIRAF
jgi:hypothetical protein